MFNIHIENVNAFDLDINNQVTDTLAQKNVQIFSENGNNRQNSTRIKQLYNVLTCHDCVVIVVDDAPIHPCKGVVSKQ